MEKIVIVGGVAAGSTAAAKVRRISSTANITMIESGPDISFANCGLPYYIGGDIKTRAKLILQSPESFKDQYNVDAYTHTTVSSINRIAHTINTVNSQSGEQKSFEYTKLILAQGGRPVIPELPGAGLSHVFTLWTLEDMDKIAHYILERAGGYRPTLYLKIENPPFMALVIEATPEPGPTGLPAISIAHYGEQNGDLMRDPEMCFELSKPPLCSLELSAFYYRMDYLGVEQYSRYRDDENYVFVPDLHRQHETFARLWDRNLRAQGFLEAFTDKSIRG